MEDHNHKHMDSNFIYSDHKPHFAILIRTTYAESLGFQYFFYLQIFRFMYFEYRALCINFCLVLIYTYTYKLQAITVMQANQKLQTDQDSPKVAKQALNGQSKSKNKKQAKKDMAKIQDQKQKQKKLSSYHFQANSITNNSNQQPLDSEEAKINELKQQINVKDKQIQKLRQNRQYIENKLSILFMDSRSFRLRSKQALIQTLTEEAEIKRKKRRRVDMRFGYYVENMKIFVQGQEINDAHTYIDNKNDEMNQLQNELKKCKNEQQKDRIRFSIQFIKKQIQAKQNELKYQQKQLYLYKERLKLGIKQLKCFYSERNWPIVKDSTGTQRYVTLELLGKGGFGEVYRCYDLQDNQYVAIKINSIKINHNNANGKQDAENILKHVQREVVTQQSLKHQNIAHIKQVLQINQERIVFVLQLCEGPQLNHYIREKKCLEEKDSKRIIHQVFAALNYLSQLDPKVIHYDLKPSNIIFHKGVIKILDFGLCKLMESEESRMVLTSPGVGTYWYLPPQTFQFSEEMKINPKVDVWSAGVIFYQMLYGKRPFANNYSQQKIMKQNLITKEAKHLVFPIQNPNRYRVSKQAKDFLEHCLAYDPEQRLSASQAFNHPYFKY